MVPYRQERPVDTPPRIDGRRHAHAEVGAGLIGHFGARRWLAVFALGGAHGSAGRGYGPALIDDDTPRSAHTGYSRRHLAKVPSAGLGLWSLAMGALVVSQGWHGTLTQMGWFFTKAALFTIGGGAYAVLPYVYPGVVEQHQ